jgi:hypothetical protein
MSTIAVIIATTLLTLRCKGSRMENTRIDRIDIKRDHKELIALFYRLELRNFVSILLYRTRAIR